MERKDKTFGHHHVNDIKGVTLLVGCQRDWAMGWHRCNHAKAKSWPCSAWNSSLWSSYCYIPAWGRIIFRWALSCPSHSKTPCLTAFSLPTRSRPTVQTTHCTNEMGKKFWSIHPRKKKDHCLFSQILSVRPGTNEIFKSSFVFKYVLLRSQIYIPRALKKWSTSSFLNSQPWDTFRLTTWSCCETRLWRKWRCWRFLLEESFPVRRKYSDAERPQVMSIQIWKAGVPPSCDWAGDVEFAECDYSEAGSRLSTHETAVADYWASLLLSQWNRTTEDQVQGQE